MKKKYLQLCWLFILVILINISLTQYMNPNKINKIRFVALGDSYTICEGATTEESWPVILTKHLNEENISIELIANPSVTGWTTNDLIEKELPIYEASEPDFATLLIGVNDWVQKVSEEQFEKNLILILDRMQAKLKVKENLILISIPDFGVTPKGQNYSGGRDISSGILIFNQIIIEEAKKRNLKTVDIYPTTQKMKNNPDLISADDLHPSAKEYALWEKLIFPVAKTILKK
jgi:acyl-CoA thioesterase-1